MQNGKCKVKNEKFEILSTLIFAFCTLHFALNALTSSGPDANRIDRILKRTDDGEDRQSARPGIFRRNVFYTDSEPPELSLNLDVVTVALEPGNSKNLYLGFIRPETGQTDGGRDVDIGGKAAAGFAGASRENLAFLTQIGEGNFFFDEIRGAFEPMGRLTRRDRDS